MITEAEWIEREAERLHKDEWLSDAVPWDELPNHIKNLWRAEAYRSVEIERGGAS